MRNTTFVKLFTWTFLGIVAASLLIMGLVNTLDPPITLPSMEGHGPDPERPLKLL